MSELTIQDDDRVKAILEHPQPNFVHEQVVMKLLGFEEKNDFDGFMRKIGEGGQLKLHGKALPAIKLDSLSSSNLLNLHRVEKGRRVARKKRKPITNVPTTDVLSQCEVYYSFGLIQKPVHMPLKRQLKIVREAVGVGGSWINQETANRRKAQYKLCMEGEDSKNRTYYNLELPFIIDRLYKELGLQYDGVWTNITKQMKDEARDTIARLMRCSHLLEPAADICIVPKRGTKRGNGTRPSPTSHTSPSISQSASRQRASREKKRTRRAKQQSSLANDDATKSLAATFENVAAQEMESEDNEVDEEANTKQQELLTDLLGRMNLSHLEALWNTGERKNRLEVGRFELLIDAIQSNQEYEVLAEVMHMFGAIPFSIDEYNALVNMKNRGRILSRKAKNFIKLKARINEGQNEFKIKDGQFIVNWLDYYTRYDAGETLPEKMMNDDGTISSRAVACIRHILYAHPKIGWVDFNNLLNEFAVLLLGRSLSLDEFASLATIRAHIQRLDNLDRWELMQVFEEFLSKPSPLGNAIFFGGANDGTLHEKANYRNVSLFTIDMGLTEDRQTFRDSVHWNSSLK